MKNRFSSFSLTELDAIQRVFREAKFCLVADDDEVSPSPRVAVLYEELITALVETDCKENGEQQRTRWQSWLLLSEERDEWRIALQRIKAHSEWRTYGQPQRSVYARTVLSPFQLNDEVLMQFISQANLTHNI
jgi:hypothetical protein